MNEIATQAGRKVVAAGVLAIAAYVLFKIVLGFVTTVAWIAVIVLAVIGVIWALRVL